MLFRMGIYSQRILSSLQYLAKCPNKIALKQRNNFNRRVLNMTTKNIGKLLYLKKPILVKIDISPLDTQSTGQGRTFAAKNGNGLLLRYPSALIKQYLDVPASYDMILEFDSYTNWHYAKDNEARIDISDAFDFEMRVLSEISRGLGLKSGLVRRQDPITLTLYTTPEIVTVKDKSNPTRNFTFFQSLNVIDSLVKIGTETILDSVSRITTLIPIVTNMCAEEYLKQLEDTGQSSVLSRIYRQIIKNGVGPNIDKSYLPIKMTPDFDQSFNILVSYSNQKFISDNLFNYEKGVTMQNVMKTRNLRNVYSRAVLEIFSKIGYDNANSFGTRHEFELIPAFGANLAYIYSFREDDAKTGAERIEKAANKSVIDPKGKDEDYLHGMMPKLFDGNETEPKKQKITGNGFEEDIYNISRWKFDESTEFLI